jgi:hypothetical protein
MTSERGQPLTEARLLHGDSASGHHALALHGNKDGHSAGGGRQIVLQ